jgi:hypothetical protein
MEILNLISRLRGDARIAQLAEEVADKSMSPVRERVEDQIAFLGVSEARGYIRARSAAVVRPMVDSLIAVHADVKPAWRSQLVERAADEVARRLLWEELGRRRETTPLRRAA